MSFKQLIAASVVSLTLMYGAPSVAAGSCGWGTVTEVREGGFNDDDLYVRLDDSVGADADSHLENTYWRTVWIRYKAETLSNERLNAIRSLAYLAFATGKSAYVYTHSSEGCSNATEISLFDPIKVPDPRLNGTDQS